MTKKQQKLERYVVLYCERRKDRTSTILPNRTDGLHIPKLSLSKELRILKKTPVKHSRFNREWCNKCSYKELKQQNQIH